jgi:hypothetical protein
MYRSLRSIYQPAYFFLNVAILVVYYSLFNFLISLQQQGAVIVVIPLYLLYLLTLTSSIAMTIGIYSIRNSINNSAKYSSTSIGTATTAIGAIIGGCNCTAPLLFGLGAFGASALDIASTINFISANETYLFVVMTAINLAITVYYLDRLSRPSCMMKKRKTR